MSCCRDAYRNAQRAYDNEVPEDEEESLERRARKEARDQRKIDDYEYERG